MKTLRFPYNPCAVAKLIFDVSIGGALGFAGLMSL